MTRRNQPQRGRCGARCRQNEELPEKFQDQMSHSMFKEVSVAGAVRERRVSGGETREVARGSLMCDLIGNLWSLVCIF